MNRFVMFLALVGAASVAWLLTGWFRKYALKTSLLDVPGDRSSHSMATPSGGGFAISVTFLTGLLLMAALELVDTTTVWAYLGAGLPVSAVGFIDDRAHVQPHWRLAVHLLASYWLLNILIPDLALPMIVVGTIALVWLLNLYNFMDGIDGIAGVEAITVLFGGVVIAKLAGLPNVSISLQVLLCGAVAGFLVWNFPKARIFMGDTGSGFIGIILGGFMVQALSDSIELFWGWLILLGCFVVDATLTLARRLLRREKVYMAHRSHAYQHASKKFGSHVPVTLFFACTNIFWLLPIAAAVTCGAADPILGLLIAWVPLAIVAFYFRAGSEDA